MQEKMMEETKLEHTMEQNSAEETMEPNKGKKKKKRGSCLVRFLIALGCVFFIFAILIIVPLLPHIKTKFASVEEFDEYGGVVLIDIPENATDIKYYCNDMFFTVESAYSFVINDKKDFDAYLEANEFQIHSDRTVSECMTNKDEHMDDVFQIRDWYDYVVEDDIKEYNVLYFQTFDGTYEAILVNEETGRFVAIKYACF